MDYQSKISQNPYHSLGRKSHIIKGRGYIHGCRVGVHVSKWLFTRQPFKFLSQIGYIHGCRVSTYNCYLHGSRSRANSDYIRGCRVSTLNSYLHGSHSRAKSAINIAAGCIQKIVIYTAAVQEPNRLYTSLPGVYKKSLFTRQPFKSQSVICIATGGIHRLLFTRQPFKSQLSYIHCCRVYIHEIVIYPAAVQEPNRLCDYCSADRGLCFHIRKKLILS